MQILMAYLQQIPVIIAGGVLLTVSILRSKTARGGQLFVLAAVIYLVLVFAMPMIYAVVMPSFIGKLAPERIGVVYGIVNFVMSVLWSIPIVLISIGIFARKSTPEVRSA